MRSIYNGIDLGVFETFEFNCEPIYDSASVDYLYTKVSMAFRAIVNGQSEVLFPQKGRPFNGPPISYDFGSGPQIAELSTRPEKPKSGVLPQFPSGIPEFNQLRPPPAAVGGFNVGPSTGIKAADRSELRPVIRKSNAPPLTHRVIRHRLTTPRGTLFVFSGPGQEMGKLTPDGDEIPPGALIIRSPSVGQVCDCKNGPFPKILSINAALGDANTFIVDWACETYINESGMNDVKGRGALLSNRFAQTHTVNENGFTTISVQGVAVFRTDLVYALPETPDLKRPVIFMPIPQGFVRENIVVTGRPDVTGVEYSYQDRQVPVNFTAAPYAHAASIAAVHRQSISQNPDLLSGALSVYERMLSIKANQRFARGEPNQKAPAAAPPWALPGRLRAPGARPAPPKPPGA